MNIWRKKIYFLGEEKEEEQIFEERKYIFLHDGTGSVCVSTGWYLVVLGQYNLVYEGTGSVWNRSGDLVGCYHKGTNRRRKGKIGLLSQTDHGRLR